MVMDENEEIWLLLAAIGDIPDLDTDTEDDMDVTIKGVARDAKIAKRKHGMRVHGRSVFVIQQSQQKRDKGKAR